MTCLPVMFPAWLIGLASEKNLSTEMTDINVADEMDRKVVKQPSSLQKPSLKLHSCFEKVTIENGITSSVINSWVEVNPTRNKLLTVRKQFLGRIMHRTVRFVNAATTSKIENKTTATTVMVRSNNAMTMIEESTQL